MEQQNGEPFNPEDCLHQSIADVICGIIFKDGPDTKNSDIDKFLKINGTFVEGADDVKIASILDFFRGVRHVPIIKGKAGSNHPALL